MDKKQKSNYREIKKKMKKLTLAEKKQIKEKEKEKEQRKDKQQKITQRVKVNINIPRSIGDSQSRGFSNFPKDNTEQTSLLKSINEQLKQKNEPKNSNELFSIPSSVMTNTQDLTNRNAISPQRKRNIPNVINKPKDTSNFSLDEVVKNKVKEYNENLAMGKEEKENNENLAMGKEEKRIPIVNVPEDTSNLGMMERINKKEEEEIKPVEEGKSVFEQNVVSFKIKKKKPEDEEKRLKKEEEKRLKDEEKRLKAEQEKRLKDEENLRLSNLQYQIRKKVKDDKQAGIERAFSVLLINSTPDQQNLFRGSYNSGFLSGPRIREILLNLRVDPNNDRSKKKFTRDEVTSFFNNE